MQGPYEKKIVEECYKRNLPLPKAIEDAPDLVQGLELYYTAFVELADSRPIGMVLGPIPWITIQEYCLMNDFSEEQTDRAHRHIRTMDLAFLEHKSRKT